MSGKAAGASAWAPPPIVLSEDRKRVIANLTCTSENLRTSLQDMGYSQQDIEVHIRWFDKTHPTPKPSLVVLASLWDAALDQGAAPLEYSSDEDEKKSDSSDEEHMEAFGASMLAAAAHAGHQPHHLSLNAQAEAAGFVPPIIRTNRKSMFDLAAQPVSAPVERELTGDSKEADLVDGS